MPAFYAAAFAVAGAVAAAGPTLIHLLNRRRYKVREWAAMDFLREAIRHRRSMLRLRDLVLLVLRTVCVVLFALAMGRPYISHGGDAYQPGQPIHAVIVVDNSLSMGYQLLKGTILDQAKAKAREFIDRLPQGSRVSLLPLCGYPAEMASTVFDDKAEAIAALDGIVVVDRLGTAAEACDMAEQALRRVPELLAKRIVLIGDQQEIGWPAGSLADVLKKLGDVQIVKVAAENVENAWIADFRAQQGAARAGEISPLLVRVRYEGPTPRANVPLTLSVDGVPVASQTLDLQPGQTRELSFPYRFDVPLEPGRMALVTASISMPPDRLAGDDTRVLVVPVLPSASVVFVDQYGAQESPEANRFGETVLLRGFLTAMTTTSDEGRPLIAARHITPELLTRDLLQDARMVFIAGVASPGASVPLLRDYVEQGGQVVIAAGGEFDPVEWNRLAWLEGAGLLPAPLEPQLRGTRVDEAVEQLRPFHLAPATMSDGYFRLPELGDTELADLYREPLFFKTVVATTHEAAITRMLEAEERRWQATIAGAKQDAADAKPAATPSVAWLAWNGARADVQFELSPRQRAERSRPRVLAAFDDGVPYMIERDIGRGQVLFVASGLRLDWNTLATCDAMIVFDRLFHAKLERTLPERNLATVDRMLLPVEPRDRQFRLTLARPGQPEEELAVDALGGDAYGVILRDLVARGWYHVRARRPEAPPDASGPDARLWDVPLAVNGPALESELRTLDAESLAERTPPDAYRWVAAGGTIRLEGALVSNSNLWRWFMSALLVGLLVEVGLLARPRPAAEAHA